MYETSCSATVTVFAELSCTITFVPLALRQIYVYLSLCLMCQMFWIGPWFECQLHATSQGEQVERATVLGESTAVRNLMPDTQCVSYFVRSLAELWASVCRYLFSKLATWPSLKALCMHACAFAACICEARCDQQRYETDNLKINRCLWWDNRKARITHRKEEVFSRRVWTWVWCPCHLVGMLSSSFKPLCDNIRSRHRGFPACRHTAAHHFTTHTVTG